jgi:hypothetical protein
MMVREQARANAAGLVAGGGGAGGDGAGAGAGAAGSGSVATAPSPPARPPPEPAPAPQPATAPPPATAPSPADAATVAAMQRAMAAANAAAALRGSPITPAGVTPSPPTDSGGGAAGAGAGAAIKTFVVSKSTASSWTSVHGANGAWSPVLTAAIEDVRAVAETLTPPERGSEPGARLPPLPDALLVPLAEVVKIVKGGYGESALPRGLIKSLMEFMEPFCSATTLQRRMSMMK